MIVGPDDADFYDEDDDTDDCPNCGGEGVIACCFEEYACIDPEGGCNECMQTCDWCTPPRAKTAEGRT